MKPIRIIGMPMDLGQKKRGVDMGPNAIRYANILKELRGLDCDVMDMGDVAIPNRSGVKKADRYQAILEASEAIYDLVRETIAEGWIPLCLGGDHSIAIGTVGGTTHESPAGVIWIDAHADFNTHKTSPSGNVHGMPLASLTGHGTADLMNIGRLGKKLPESHVVMIGIRNLDFEEKKKLQQSEVTVFTMRDIDEKGMKEVMNLTLMRLQGLDRIHVSLDMDSIDPGTAPGVGTPVSGGLSPREAHYLLEMIAETGLCCSADIVEVNPIRDEYNRTGNLAVELATSLFGKQIY